MDVISYHIWQKYCKMKLEALEVDLYRRHVFHHINNGK